MGETAVVGLIQRDEVKEEGRCSLQARKSGHVAASSRFTRTSLAYPLALHNPLHENGLQAPLVQF